MTVRAKFACDSITARTSGDMLDGYDIKMSPVVGGSDENERFFRYTPWGALEIGIVSAETAKRFEEGKEYYLDISAAAPSEPAAVEPKAAHVPNDLMQFFAYEHLPDRLKQVSMNFWNLADVVDQTLPNGAEKTTTLRKLLEAKDCAVRSVIYKKGA